LAIPAEEDDADIREKYRPFILPEGGEAEKNDWVKDVELATVTEMALNDMKSTGERLKVLVLYGSLRGR
jgi:arsenic resistance protein ArsH